MSRKLYVLGGLTALAGFVGFPHLSNVLATLSESFLFGVDSLPGLLSHPEVQIALVAVAAFGVTYTQIDFRKPRKKDIKVKKGK